MQHKMAFIVVLLLMICTSFGCTKAPTPTPVGTPQPRDLEGGMKSGDITASGKIVPLQEMQLSFEILGRISDIHVGIGDRVTAGEGLVQLDAKDLVAVLTQANAEIGVAKLERAKLDAPPDELALATAELGVRAAAVALSQTLLMRDAPHLGVTEAERLFAESSLAVATTDRKEAFELHERMLTCIDIAGYGEICPLLGAPEENSRFRWEAAEANLAASQAEFNALRPAGYAEIRLADANVNLAKTQKELAEAYLVKLNAPALAQEKQVADAAVAGAEIAIQTAQTALDHAILISPMDGIVMHVSMQPGEVALPGIPVITLADLTQFLVETTNLSELDIGRVKPGQKVTLYIEALQDQQIEGAVKTIDYRGGLLGGDIVYPVTITLNEVPSGLRLGMSVDVIIHTE